MKIFNNELYDIDNIDLKNGVLTIPNGIVNVKDSVIIKNKKVFRIDFSKSVKRIHNNIFNCDSLRELNFESSLFKIYGDGICDFSKLKKLIIYNQELISKNIFNSYDEYLKIMNKEISDIIYENIEKINCNIEKEKILDYIKNSDTICNYINEIIYDILNFEDYDCEEDIELLCMAIADICCINEDRSIKIYQKIN